MTRHRAEQMPYYNVAKYLDKAVADGWEVLTVSAMSNSTVFVVITREE